MDKNHFEYQNNQVLDKILKKELCFCQMESELYTP